MAHSSSQSAYYEAHNQLKKDAPKSVLHYFDVNWHPIRDQWVLGLKFGCGSFLNSTNNRLESINGKLKQVISRKTGFTVFLDQFFIIINALRTERDHKAAVSFQKTRIHVYSSGSAESSYAKLLTPYAFRFVLKQMTLIDKVQEILPSEDDYVTNSTNEGQIVVSLRDCSCIFRRSMGLPCRHMLSLAKKLEKPLFNELLCDKRWTLDYYRQVHRVFDKAPDEPTSYVTSTEASASHVKKMTQHEKFRKASLIASQLASVTSESSNVHFERRIEVLKDLIDYWKEGIEVSVVEVEDDLESDQDEFSVRDASSGRSATANKTFGPPTTKIHHVPRMPDENTLEKEQPTKLGIAMPPAVKKRGRPKGNELTVIGLPAKRSKKGKDPRQPSKFVSMHSKKRDKISLSWFVSEQLAEKALTLGIEIEEEDVESKPENIPDAARNEDVDITSIRRYFTRDAWLLVEDVMRAKVEGRPWRCHACQGALSDDPKSICCDSCLNWYHFRCASVIKEPRSSTWFCRGCHNPK